MLTAWLGWYYTELANQRPELAAELKEKIESCQHWVEVHATQSDWLPEQVPENLNVPSYYLTWMDRWGKIASPLLWSHAQYIILRSKSRFDWSE